MIFGRPGREVKDEDVADILGVADSTVLFEISSAILGGDLEKCIVIIGNVFTQGIDIRQFYRGLMEHFRNLTVAKIGANPRLFPELTPNEIEQLAHQSKEFSLERLQVLLKVLLESEGYIYRAPLPRILLEAILLRMATIPPAASLKEILDKLTDFQEKLMGITSSPKNSATLPAFSLETEDSEPGEGSSALDEPGLPVQKQVPLASLSGEEMSQEESWKALIDFIRTKKPLLASLLDHGQLLKKDRNNIDIAFPKNSLFLESIQEASKKRELGQICEEYFGEETKVKLHVLTSPSNESEDQKSILTPAQKAEKIREEARNHPLVREALNIFGGGITEIKVMN